MDTANSRARSGSRLSLVAVSYTHLDVYKRQVINRETSGDCLKKHHGVGIMGRAVLNNIPRPALGQQAFQGRFAYIFLGELSYHG